MTLLAYWLWLYLIAENVIICKISLSATLLYKIFSCTLCHSLWYDITDALFTSLQDSLYHAIMQRVNTFRELLGMPDVERFNVVLFGGKQHDCTHVVFSS